ncbi:hypothetical protein ROZALSC1DRAFT_25970 [Rozella allomycis CSF55]|uniref:Uncharacterized protein n=1 Tax=Rozella allomycis (strain CSF55) TaxID=988480 RepID=A0A4P9YAI9_ROZAC|nr:hypothetical protein ROZALSC1DRAFT_25970 [Rozella allomycis CSF55]
MESSSLATIDHAYAEVKQLLYLVSRKSISGPIAIEICNTVLIPKLTYRLRLTPMTDAQLHKFDKLLIQFVKAKLQLPKNFRNDLLWGLPNTGLNNFGEHMKKQWIHDALWHLRNTNLPGQIFQAAHHIITTTVNHPGHLLELPFDYKRNANKDAYQILYGLNPT